MNKISQKNNNNIFQLQWRVEKFGYQMNNEYEETH